MNISDVKIAIIALGYLGIPLVFEFAKKHQSLCFDINQARIDVLKVSTHCSFEVSEVELANI